MTERRRVAYVLGHYPSTSQTFLRDEIQGVEAAGIDVDRVAINPPMAALTSSLDVGESERTTYIKGASPLRVLAAVVRAALHDPGAFLATLGAALASGGTDLRRVVWGGLYFVEALVLWAHCDARGIRQLHAHFTVPASTVAWLAARFGGAGWRWSMTIHGPHDFFDEPAMLLPQKAGSVAAVVCISDYGRAQVLRNMPEEHWHKVLTRRCGVDVDRFAPRRPRPIGTPARLLAVGRLAPEKGQLVLLEALRTLLNSGTPATLDVVGRGPDEEPIRRLVGELGLDDVVRLHGELPPEQVVARVADADVLCLPSFNEGIPISLMEAMAVGVPVVTTTVGGVPELVEDGRTGFLVPPGRADLLADALGRLLADPALVDEVVERARERVLQRHDLRRTTADLAATLEAVA